MASVYEQCKALYEDNPYAVLQCLTEAHEHQEFLLREEFLEWFVVIAASLVFFMQCGFAMLCAGCVRKKNLQNTMLKNLLDASGAALAFFCTGYAFAYGGQGKSGDTKSFIGTSNFFAKGDVNMAFWFFQYACSSTTVTIVAGTLAERCRMMAYLTYSTFLAGFVYPVVAHAMWTPQGILSASSSDPFMGTGAIDFSGAGVIHLTGGTTALIASYFLGPRKGRFYHHKTGELLPEPRVFPGHSIALQLLGTLVLWFGWYGFNPGSALLLGHGYNVGQIASRSAVNTALSSSVAGITALLFTLWKDSRKSGEFSFDIASAMNGVLGGLVGITAACATLDPWAAALTGAIAGIVYCTSSDWLIRLKIDDVVNAVPVHCFCGIWGMLAVGLFAKPEALDEIYGFDDHVGWVYEWGRGSADVTLLFSQFVACLFIMGWALVTMGPFFYLLQHMNWFRSDNIDELLGLDQIYHGGVEGESRTDVKKKLGYIRGLLNEPSVSSQQSSAK